MEVIKLSTSNDVNGNPRRVFVAIDDTDIVGAWDEGHEGHHAVPPELQEKARRAPMFQTTPSEYKATLREFRRRSGRWEPATILAQKKGCR